jgi:tRNA/rRNA methyltransferase
VSAPVRLVLVRPATPANVGACARVVRNGGLEGLDLVAPGDWRTVECWRTAWGAQDVLEQARTFDDLRSALADATFVAGLSGRPDASAPTLDVRDMAQAIAVLRSDDRAAVVLGPEASGLSKEELACCGRRVAIPTDPVQPSLNLSHAAAIAAYEIYRAARSPEAGPARAAHADKARMLALLRAALVEMGALPARDTSAHVLEWEALFQRADLTAKEARLLEHLARRLAKAVSVSSGS